MKRSTLILRSLCYHWPANVSLMLSAAVATAILVGALTVGDSVRGTLADRALSRLGRTDTALFAQDRFFRAKLADDLSTPDSACAPVLSIVAKAQAGDGSAAANGVRVLGVDRRFWEFANVPSAAAAKSGAAPAIGPGQVAINERLAAQLGVTAGQEIVLRLAKPSLLPMDSVLAGQKDTSVAFRVRVVAVISPGQLGDFGLDSRSLVPFNAFVPLDWLGEKIALPGQANMLLAEDSGATADAGTADRRLRDKWTLADAQLNVASLPSGQVELRSSRVFVDPPAAAAAMAAGGENPSAILTYFVNELAKADRATPYSMVAAVDPARMGTALKMSAGAALGDDEILISDWLAGDIGSKPGDTLQMKYFVLDGRRLVERTQPFRVRGVYPLADMVDGRELMPQFPGLADVDNCRDWKAGVPIDFARIRTKDQDYWDQHRGTPKALITLRTGQAIWGNRFGNVTAVRYPQGDAAGIAGAIRARLDPATAGLFFVPVRQRAMATGQQSLDFGQLFVGFSIFILFSAILLMVLVFVLAIQRRSAEVGTLLALGFGPRVIRRMLLVEALLPAAIGTSVGAALGLLYAKAMLAGLAGTWSGAVASMLIEFHCTWMSVIVGGVGGLVVAAVAMATALWRQFRQPARDLLAAGAGSVEIASPASRTRRWASLLVGQLTLAAAIAIPLAAAGERSEQAAGAFFASGGALLLSSLAFCYWLLSPRLTGNEKPRGVSSLVGLAIRNGARRRGRSLATIALLACATFLIIAVGANRQDPQSAAGVRASGTGGFALLAESSIPVAADLSSAEGIKALGLDRPQLRGVEYVPMKLHEGDEANCLNMARPQVPRLLGVEPGLLADRGAFEFLQVTGETKAGNPWRLLSQKLSDGAVPAIGDENTIRWSLGKKVGDTIACTDERGRTFRIRLVGVIANSILQGSLLISQEQFVSRFPSEGGYRVLLADVPAGDEAGAGATLTEAMADFGLAVTPATRRLAELEAVENGYLSIFTALGGLGLILGSVGLALVVLRNAMERRGEWAILRAIGFTRGRLMALVLLEHWALLMLGLACGVVAAIVAVLPALWHSHEPLPLASLGWTLLAVLACGLVSSAIATAAVMRGSLVDALRSE